MVVGLSMLSAEHKLPINYRVIKAFYILVDRESPPFLLSRSKGLFTKLPYSQKRWKEKFFILESETEWDFPTKWTTSYDLGKDLKLEKGDSNIIVSYLKLSRNGC